MSKKPDDRPPATHQPPHSIIQPMIDELKPKPAPKEDLGAPKPAPPEAEIEDVTEENPDPDDSQS